MARHKQRTPMKREPSSELFPRSPSRHRAHVADEKATNGHATPTETAAAPHRAPKQAGLSELIVCVGGIYASLCVPT